MITYSPIVNVNNLFENSYYQMPKQKIALQHAAKNQTDSFETMGKRNFFVSPDAPRSSTGCSVCDAYFFAASLWLPSCAAPSFVCLQLGCYCCQQVLLLTQCGWKDCSIILTSWYCSYQNLSPREQSPTETRITS